MSLRVRASATSVYAASDSESESALLVNLKIELEPGLRLGVRLASRDLHDSSSLGP
jgi:hypothetical protein